MLLCYLYWWVHITETWCSIGKKASRNSLKPDIARVRTRSATLRTVDESENIVQDDSIVAQASPTSEDSHVLLSSGNDADAREIATTSPSEQSLEDSALETGHAELSEMNTAADQAKSTDEASLEPEAVTPSEILTTVEKAIKIDTNAASIWSVSIDEENMLRKPDAESAASVTVPSPPPLKETEKIEEAMTVETANNSSPSPLHSLNIPEALLTDDAGALLSPMMDKPRMLTAEGQVLEQPHLDSSITPSANVKTPTRASPRKKSKPLPPYAVTTPGAARTPKLLLPANLLQTDFVCETPQIGTSLLRRESLRRKESPSKKNNTRRSKTPKKRDTLQRRDTLQEREILQKVIAETTADQINESLDTLPTEISTLTSSDFALRAGDHADDNAHAISEPVLRGEQTGLGIIACAEDVSPSLDETNVEKDLHRALEAIEVYEHAGITDSSQPPLDISPEETQRMEAKDKANEVLARTELDDASQAIEVSREQAPNQKTRSGARFSDDTSMLKDFLNRAQARKAAQKPLLSAPDAPISQVSPRRSPRKMHGSQNGHAPSPRKSRKIPNRSSSPPGKPKPEPVDSDGDEEQTAEAASCRRSTRTRLPAPPKAPPGAPSFIPVRRADGTDPVVLQKSQAQELAVTTRANTRRNKGQSKPPLLALQDLPTEVADLEMTAKGGAERVKSVAWAERLASYRDAKDEMDEVEERRPKVRRLRGLGGVNGTPTGKRPTAVVGSSNGTPAAKRLGKV